MQRRLYSNCAIGKSDIEGWGLFARDDIKKGDLILEYIGEIIEHEETSERDKWNEIEKITYLFTLNSYVINALLLKLLFFSSTMFRFN